MKELGFFFKWNAFGLETVTDNGGEEVAKQFSFGIWFRNSGLAPCLGTCSFLYALFNTTLNEILQMHHELLMLFLPPKETTPCRMAFGVLLLRVVGNIS